MAYVDEPAGIADFKNAVQNPSWQYAQDRLNAVQHVRFTQGRALLEGLTGGAMPNKFMVTDMTNQYQPQREGQNYGDMEGWPMFVIEEVGGGCCERDCLCRCCCSPGHPSISHLHATTGPIETPDLMCCGTSCGHQRDHADAVGDAILTYERLGCCARFANCFVCCELCQDEMRFHTGRHDDPNIAGDLPKDDIIAIGKVPIGGGGCTPTVNVFDMSAAPGLTGDKVEDMNLPASMVVEGPTCFGGLYDWCCDTTFHVSTEAGKHDMATIIKKKPEDCCGEQMCRACCTTADIYDMHVAPTAQMTGMQKAIIMGELVHLDFMFFEKDQFPITCEVQDKTIWITVMLCLCYCGGCLCPIKCCIPCKAGGDD